MSESAESMSCVPALPLKCSVVLGKPLDLLFLSFPVFKNIQSTHHTWLLQELINCNMNDFEDFYS